MSFQTPRTLLLSLELELIDRIMFVIVLLASVCLECLEKNSSLMALQRATVAFYQANNRNKKYHSRIEQKENKADLPPATAY